jgi:hypothetical protein
MTDGALSGRDDRGNPTFERRPMIAFAVKGKDVTILRILHACCRRSLAFNSPSDRRS